MGVSIPAAREGFDAAFAELLWPLLVAAAADDD